MTLGPLTSRCRRASSKSTHRIGVGSNRQPTQIPQIPTDSAADLKHSIRSHSLQVPSIRTLHIQHALPLSLLQSARVLEVLTHDTNLLGFVPRVQHG